MARDFSELARIWIETFGGDIAKLPQAKLVKIANMCINADIVHSMDPVMPDEGMHLAVAVDIALDNEKRDIARANYGMPKLTGTKNQVLWADLIRKDAIKAARLLRQRAMRQMDKVIVLRLDQYVALMLRNESKAKWFIDNRNDFVDFPAVTNEKAYYPQIEKIAPVGEAEKNALEEMTVRPKNERRMGAIELTASSGDLLAVLARNSDFLEIVNNQRMNWDAKALGWRQKRVVGETTTEHIAKLATALLAEGFTVMVSDNEARKEVQSKVDGNAD